MKKKNSKKKECTRVVYGGPMQVTRDRKYTDEEREDAMLRTKCCPTRLHPTSSS